MTRRGTGVALALVLASLCGIPAGARPSPDETILIRFRHPYAICAGVCPAYRLAVDPEGDVVTHDLFRAEHYRFRVGLRQHEKFLRILRSIRPEGERRLDAHCEQARLPDGSVDPLDDPRPDDMEILWLGDDAQTRLTSCGYTHRDIRRIVESAVRALGIDPFTGDRAQPEDD